MGSNIEPKVFLLGEPRVNMSGLQALLTHLGAPTWTSDASSDIELLSEVYGRACYKSFGAELNPNITRVRKTNRAYLQNVVEKGDGSVLEHGMVNWFFADVSRVFTHELVRHRVGVGISQESLRFVRLTDLNWYAPTVVKETLEVMEFYGKTFEELGAIQKELARMFEMDSGLSFDQKKKLTSSMRRLAPMGLATNIGWSCNLRTLRHVIEQRTAPWAEEEIRVVFAEVAEQAIMRWPNVFWDYRSEVVDGIRHYFTEHRKV